MKRAIWVFLLVSSIGTFPCDAATIYSNRNGNWGSSSTWQGGIPKTGDDVVIRSGHTVDLNANPTIGSITIIGTLDNDGSNQTITLNGDWNRTGTFIPGTRITVVLAGSGTMTPTTFHNLTVSGNYTVAGNFVVNNVLNIPGYFGVGSSVISIRGSGTCFSVAGTFDYGTSTIVYDGNANQNIAATSYYSLSTGVNSGSTRYTKTSQGNITCYGTLTVGLYSTIAMGPYQISVQGDLTHLGTGNTDAGYITWSTGVTSQGTIRFFGSGNSYITPNSRSNDNDIHNMTIEKNSILDTVKLSYLAAHVVGVRTGGAMRFLSGVFDYTDMRLSPDQTDPTASVYVAPGAIVRAGEDNFPFNVFNTTSFVPHTVNNVTVSNGSILEYYSVANSSQTKYIRGSEANIASYGTVRVMGGGQKLLSGNIVVNDSLVLYSNTAINLNSRTLSYGANAVLRYLLSDSTASAFQVGQTSTNAEFPATNGPSRLVIDNPLNVTLHAARTLSAGLTFQNGKLILGANTLTIGSTGTVLNPNSMNYVVTNGTGVLKRNGVGVASTVFPVGPSTTSYNPATISIVGNTDNFGVRVGTTISPAIPDATTAVARMWTIAEDSPGSSSGTLTLQWNASDEGSNFNRSNPITINQYTTSWVERNASLAGANPYTASANMTSWSSFIVSSGLPLPVELVAFSGSWNDGIARLSWKTASEYQCIGFEVERSEDTWEWTRVDFVPGNWTTLESHTYRFDDRPKGSPRSGRWWYRLRQVDGDGSTHLSSVISVTPLSSPNSESSISVTPSFARGALLVSYQSAVTASAEIRLVDMLGRVLRTDVIHTGTSGSESSMRLSLHSIPPGRYFIVANNGQTQHMVPIVVLP